MSTVPETRPLTPETRRRPDALSGSLVKLADGQLWELPKPRVRLSPSGDGYDSVLSIHSTDDYQSYVDAFDVEAPEDDEDDKAWGEFNAKMITACIRIAVALLKRNYDLTDQECRRLVQFSFNKEADPEGFAMKEEVVYVGLGYGPKPSSGTSSSA